MTAINSPCSYEHLDGEDGPRCLVHGDACPNKLAPPTRPHPQHPKFMAHYVPATLRALKVARVTVGEAKEEGGDKPVTLTFEDDGHQREPYMLPDGLEVPSEGDYLVITGNGDVILWNAQYFERTYVKAG